MRRTFCTTMAALSVAAALHAQEPAQKRRANTPPPTAPVPRPRIGYAGTPTPPPAPVGQPNYNYNNSPSGYFVSTAAYVVLSDGSVLANFGNGYERVLRACGSARKTAPADPYARDVLGRIPPPPGIAALQAGSRGQLSGNTPARNSAACYRSEGRGRMDVVTTGH
jgi:hypothetical protein